MTLTYDATDYIVYFTDETGTKRKQEFPALDLQCAYDFATLHYGRYPLRGVFAKTDEQPDYADEHDWEVIEEST